jgi:hypothetical protein
MDEASHPADVRGERRGGQVSPKAAVPGLYVGPDSEPGPLLHTLDVDGETFQVRRSRGGGTDYDWVSGRNAGYGSGSSAPADQPVEQHVDSNRSFLTMIDPATGYIAD